MSKIKRSRAQGQRENPRSRRKMFIIVGTLISLILTSGALAQWTGILSVTNKSSGAMTPPSYDPATPVTEYIYANGRLIATEAPLGGGCGSGLSAPTGLLATATSVTSVSLTWNASTGAVDHYEVERKRNINDPYVTVIFNVPPSSPTVSVSDSNLSVDTAYLYRVRAFDSASCPSPYSEVELATTTIFPENIVAGVTIKANHLTELRRAVNAVRATAGLALFNWSDSPTTETPAIGGFIRKEQVQKLRNNLDPARSALGLLPQSYTNQPLTLGVIVQAVHIQQLRNGVK